VYRSKVECVFLLESKSDDLSISTAIRCARPEVTSPFDRTTVVSIIVFSTHILSNLHCFKVLFVFFVIVDYGGMSILTARGLLSPGVMSPADGATKASSSCLSTFAILLVPYMYV
jgi:hypothetical protein